MLDPKCDSCYTYKIMKANLHPEWFPEAKVSCACGTTFITGSTVPAIRVEICSTCHPFYTGTQKFVDTLGQVDRFVKKMEVSKSKQAQQQRILANKKAKMDERKKERPSLKDLLMQARKNIS